MAADPVHRIRRSSAQRTPDRPDDDQLTLPLFDAPQSEDAAAIDNVGAEPPGVGGDGRRAGDSALEDLRSQHDRVLVARIAAAERWARTSDRTQATAPARRGLTAKFEREADPDGVLPPGERTRRADLLMRAHMLRMARRSALARRRPA